MRSGVVVLGEAGISSQKFGTVDWEEEASRSSARRCGALLQPTVIRIEMNKLRPSHAGGDKGILETVSVFT